MSRRMAVPEVEQILKRITFSCGLAKLGASIGVVKYDTYTAVWYGSVPDTITLRATIRVPDRDGMFANDIEVGDILQLDSSAEHTDHSLAKLVAMLFVRLMEHEAREGVRFDGKLVDDPHAIPPPALFEMCPPLAANDNTTRGGFRKRLSHWKHRLSHG